MKRIARFVSQIYSTSNFVKFTFCPYPHSTKQQWQERKIYKTMANMYACIFKRVCMMSIFFSTILRIKRTRTEEEKASQSVERQPKVGQNCGLIGSDLCADALATISPPPHTQNQTEGTIVILLSYSSSFFQEKAHGFSHGQFHFHSSLDLKFFLSDDYYDDNNNTRKRDTRIVM